MKKIIVIVSIILVICIGIGLGFRKLEKDREPFYVNREQFVEVFMKDRDPFQQLADILKEHKDVYYFHNLSNPTLEFPGITDERLPEIMAYMINEVGIDTITRDYYGENDLGVLKIYQSRGDTRMHIEVGVTYDYMTGKWEYLYDHNYDYCKGNHNKILYKLYDKLYNKETEIVLN